MRTDGGGGGGGNVKYGNRQYAASVGENEYSEIDNYDINAGGELKEARFPIRLRVCPPSARFQTFRLAFPNRFLFVHFYPSYFHPGFIEIVTAFWQHIVLSQIPGYMYTFLMLFCFLENIYTFATHCFVSNSRLFPSIQFSNEFLLLRKDCRIT